MSRVSGAYSPQLKIDVRGAFQHVSADDRLQEGTLVLRYDTVGERASGFPSPVCGNSRTRREKNLAVPTLDGIVQQAIGDTEKTLESVPIQEPTTMDEADCPKPSRALRAERILWMIDYVNRSAILGYSTSKAH